MPTHLLAYIQAIYRNDVIILEDGGTTDPIHPTRGVRQGCPLSPLLFALYVSDLVEFLPQGGAYTADPDLTISHVEFADDFVLVHNKLHMLQELLNALHAFSIAKDLVVNVAKSALLAFNMPAGADCHCFYDGAEIPRVHEFKYLGVWFTATADMTTTSKRMVVLMNRGVGRVWEIIKEFELMRYPALIFRVFKVFSIGAGMYGAQVWSTPFLKGFAYSRTPQHQSMTTFLHRLFSISRVGVNHALLLRECGQDPISFLWWRCVIRFWNKTLSGRSPLLLSVVRADLILANSGYSQGWAAEVLSALRCIPGGAGETSKFFSGQAISLNQFLQKVRSFQRLMWLNAAGSAFGINSDAVTYYQHNVSPMLPARSLASSPFKIPWFLFQKLPQHVRNSFIQFRTRAHCLRARLHRFYPSQYPSPNCDLCGDSELQDETHVVISCPAMPLATLRSGFAFLPFSSLQNLLNCTDIRVCFFIHKLLTTILSLRPAVAS